MKKQNLCNEERVKVISVGKKREATIAVLPSARGGHIYVCTLGDRGALLFTTATYTLSVGITLPKVVFHPVDTVRTGRRISDMTLRITTQALTHFCLCLYTFGWRGGPARLFHSVCSGTGFY